MSHLINKPKLKGNVTWNNILTQS